MALDTVQDYVDYARTLLQDTVVEYRYSDVDLVNALSVGVMEARRLRPDLFKAYFNTTLPSYSTAAMSAAVDIDPQYRMAFVYYLCGIAQLRDDETEQDSRASAFLQRFATSLQAPGA